MNAKEIRNLQEAYLQVYSGIAESAVGDRTRRAVDNQRGGFHGDDDAMNQAQKGLAASMEKLRKSPTSPTLSYISRASADRAAKEAEDKVRSGKARFEEVDVYDVVLSHLLDEGYADTVESAEVIMMNMSEEWRENIIEEKSTEPDPFGRPGGKHGGFKPGGGYDRGYQAIEKKIKELEKKNKKPKN